MQLADLLVSYKQVQSPKFEIPENTEEDFPVNKFQRMVEFIQNKENQKKEEQEKKQEDTQINYNYSFPKIEYNSNKQLNFSDQIYNKYPNYSLFKNQFDKYLSDRNDINNIDKQTLKDILTPIAAMESGFNSKIGNKNSSALGYFQFIDGTRNKYSKSSRQEFISNPSKQFETAINYYNSIKQTLKPYEDKIKERKITPLQAVYGMWWRPASMIKFLKTGSDDYISQSDKLTLKDILNKAKKWNV